MRILREPITDWLLNWFLTYFWWGKLLSNNHFEPLGSFSTLKSSHLLWLWHQSIHWTNKSTSTEDSSRLCHDRQNTAITAISACCRTARGLDCRRIKSRGKENNRWCIIWISTTAATAWEVSTAQLSPEPGVPERSITLKSFLSDTRAAACGGTPQREPLIPPFNSASYDTIPPPYFYNQQQFVT